MIAGSELVERGDILLPNKPHQHGVRVGTEGGSRLFDLPAATPADVEEALLSVSPDDEGSIIAHGTSLPDCRDDDKVKLDHERHPVPARGCPWASDRDLTRQPSLGETTYLSCPRDSAWLE